MEGLNGRTRGCQDEEEARGQTAARISPEETSTNTAATQEEEKAVIFSCCVRTHCVTKGQENQLSSNIRFPRRRRATMNPQPDQSEHYLISSESCSPRSCDVCHHPKTSSNRPMFLSLSTNTDSAMSLSTLLVTRESPCQNIS